MSATFISGRCCWRSPMPADAATRLSTVNTVTAGACRPKCDSFDRYLPDRRKPPLLDPRAHGREGGAARQGRDGPTENAEEKEERRGMRRVTPEEMEKWVQTEELLLKTLIRRTYTRDLLTRMRDICKVDSSLDEDDLHQELLLLAFALRQNYGFAGMGLLSPTFISILRKAFGRDLLDILKRSAVHIHDGERREARRPYFVELDAEEDRSDEVADDRRVYHKAVILSPERGYEIGLVTERILRRFSSSQPISKFVQDLLANADLCSNTAEGTALYRGCYAKYDRIPAKAMAKLHGLSEHHRKDVLRKITEYLALEGMVKGQTRTYRHQHGPKRRRWKAAPGQRAGRSATAGRSAGGGRKAPRKTH